MTHPLISVVIPIHNGAHYLRQAIDSVLAQTYKPIEIIAVDDGSTDDSPAILDSYGGRIHVLRQTNGGVSAARNAGIRHARGTLIAFLDQDDWWLPKKLERQVEVLTANADVGLVHTDAAHYDDPSGLFVERMNPFRTDLLVGRCFDRLLLGNAIFNSSVIVRKAVLDTVGGFNKDITRNTIQDYDLWLRIAQQSEFAYIPEQLTVYRLHPNQGMWRVRDSLIAELCLLDRVVGKTALAASSEMKQRVAGVLHQLTIAHLDAGDNVAARATAARSLRLRWNWRNFVVLGLTFLPGQLSNRLRLARSRLRTCTKRNGQHKVPSWSNLGPGMINAK